MKNSIFLIMIICFSWVGLAPAQEIEPLHLSKEEGPDGSIIPSRTAIWLYHGGDLNNGATPELDDSNWEPIIDTSFDSDFVPETGWPGIGWYRLHFTVDSSFVHLPLALYFEFKGALEIYLNGKLIDTYGKVGVTKESEHSVIHEWPNPRYTRIDIPDASVHYVLAIRHSNHVAASFQSIGSLLAGFGIIFTYPHHLTPALTRQTRKESAIQFAFTCFPAAFALIFGLLYAFYPTDRQYLYFALLALGVAGQTFVDLQLDVIAETDVYWAWRRMLTFFGVFTVIMLLFLVYDFLYESFPRYFYFLVAAGALVGAVSMIFPFLMFRILGALGLAIIFEILRLVIVAFRKKHEGAWLLGIGILVFIVGMSYDLVLDLELIDEIRGIRNGYYLGFMGLLIAMATYLARRFARTNKNLADQIVEVERLMEKTLSQEREVQQKEMDRLRLEAENERKQMALEKAEALEASYQALQDAHEHLKNTQDQLVHSEKMASLGKLTAGIAHEIKNPLNFVNNFASLCVELAEELEETLAPGENASELLQDIKENTIKIAEHGGRMDRIVQSMMKHATGKKGVQVLVQLNEFVEEYLNLAYNGMRAQIADFNVEIKREYDERIGQIKLVPQDFGRVLINLFNNAFDAMCELQGKLKGNYQARLTVSTQKAGDTVEILVMDNGPGIPKDTQEKIFEPFFTTRPPGSGTGLGLSLSFDIVVSGHGGNLEVESNSGQGATFRVTLPV